MVHRRFRRWFLILSPVLWKRRLMFWAGGVAVGIVAVGFAIGADYAQAAFRRALAVSPLIPLLVTPCGLALAVAVTRRFFPGSQGSGIPQAIAARGLADEAARSSLLSLRIAFGKIALTLLALFVGAAAGREGPTVQVGASIMHAVGRWTGGTHRGLVLAGGAAGIAAAFNTPLAGIVFAIEEMSRSYEHRTSGLVLTAVILAGISSLGLLGNYTYFGHTAAALATPAQWIAVPVCGVAGGLLGGAFSRMVILMAHGLPGPAGALLRRHPVAFAASCGLLLALVGLASGSTTYGTGYDEARRLLAGDAGMPWSFGVLKLLATLLTSISGVPGGIFSPSLAVGVGLGANLSALLPVVPYGAMILLGMVGYFAGVVQAPITAFVIVLEMTGGDTMAVPLMATSVIAYGASTLVCPKPIYHALADGFLAAFPRSARR
jgi:H+/Cl- antiporter ClcA